MIQDCMAALEQWLLKWADPHWVDTVRPDCQRVNAPSSRTGMLPGQLSAPDQLRAARIRLYLMGFEGPLNSKSQGFA
jgi:hypothetical protein